MQTPELPQAVVPSAPVVSDEAAEAPEKIKSMIGGLRKKVARMKEINDEERAIQHLRADAEE